MPVLIGEISTTATKHGANVAVIDEDDCPKSLSGSQFVATMKVAVVAVTTDRAPQEDYP